MYLLYLDESGNEDNPADKHFVLGGAAVYERVTYFLSQRLDELQTKHFPGSPPIEFHASSIRKGKDFWRDVDLDIRNALLRDIATVIQRANKPGVALFAAVIEKNSEVYGDKAVELAIAEVCSRFDVFLKRKFTRAKDRQRGLLVFSQGRFDKRAKVLVRNFRQFGTPRGFLRNLADIPYFAASAETRLLQLADFVAYGAYQLYEKREPSLMRPILERFDKSRGTLHGLFHYRAKVEAPCDCPACISRRVPNNFGNWAT